MTWITNLVVWTEARLAAGWFQYGYVVVATVFTWNVMRWSEHYAEISMGKVDPLGIAAVIAAVNAVAAGVQTFAFKHTLWSAKE